MLKALYNSILPPTDLVSIWNHLNFLGSIQSGSLFRRLKTSNLTISCTVYIGYPFSCRVDRRDTWKVPKVLTRFEPGNSSHIIIGTPALPPMILWEPLKKKSGLISCQEKSVTFNNLLRFQISWLFPFEKWGMFVSNCHYTIYILFL